MAHAVLTTYGTVTRDKKGNFQIACEPHVRIRLKNWLGGVAKARLEYVTLVNTDKNCRELLWFLGRYPMKMGAAVRKRLEGGSESQLECVESVTRILGGDFQIPSVTMALPARPYQEQAAAAVFNTGSLLLVDQIGVGKTCSAIRVMADQRALPALAVVPAPLTHQWADEIRRFVPGLCVHILQGGGPYDLAEKVGQEPHVIVTSYHKLPAWADHLMGKIRFIVFDEAQELRTGDKAAKNQAAALIAAKADYRLGLSVGPASIVCFRGGPFGLGWMGSIEDAYDLLQLPTHRTGEYEIKELTDVFSRGWGEDGFCWKPVHNFIRHPCTKKAYSLKCRGRHLVVTEDHSVFTVDPDARFRTKRGDALAVDDRLVLDDGAHWEPLNEVPLDVPDICASMGRAQVVVDLSGITRTDLGIERWEWQNFHREAIYGPRLPISLYRDHRHHLPDPEWVYLAPSKKAYRVRSRILLSRWAYVLGFFLGNGWISSCTTRVTFAVCNKDAACFRQRLVELPDVELAPCTHPGHGASVEFRCNNRIWATILQTVLGNRRAHNKRIPAEWICTWPKPALRALVQGLVDSDGHIDTKGRITVCTTSRALAMSLIVLLHRLGIAPSVTPSPPSPGGFVRGRQIKGRHTRYDINWSGHAWRGDNQGFKGLRSRAKGPFHEGVLRQVTRVDSPKYVYDLEMGGHPSFVADGILVHNTATPVYNYGGEIFNILNVLSPGALGDQFEFEREWCVGSAPKTIIEEPRAFSTYLRESGLMMRRTRDDVGQHLPPLSTMVHNVDCNASSAFWDISTSAAEMARIVLDNAAKNFDRMRAGGLLDTLVRQATGVAKAPGVAALVRLLASQGEKVVLFGWHREVYGVWKQLLSDLDPAWYTGTESSTKKHKEVERFVDGDAKVLIMSLRSGLGLNRLQEVCATAVHGELDWSPGVHEQCNGRLDRPGQKRPVFAHYAIADSGSDPIVCDVLGLKRGQVEGIRDPDGVKVVQRQIDPAHIKRLAKDYLERVKTPQKDSPA